MSKKQILIVEDERIIAQDLKKTLVQFDYEVCSIVSSGISAVEKADELRPDLILMDILLENDMSGIEAADQIKSILNIPLIYITAFADEKTLQKAKITEPFAYLLKPFEEKELRAAIEMALYRNDIIKKQQKSEARFRQLVETMNEGLIMQDEFGLITYANYQFCRMLRYSQQEIVGKHFTSFIKKTEHKAFKNRMLKWKEGFQESYEQTFIDKYEDFVFAYISPKPKFSDNGVYEGVIEAVANITPLKKAQEKIEQQNRFYENTINSLSYPFYVIDADSYKILISNSAADLEKKYLGNTCFNIAHELSQPCDEKNHPCPVKKVRKSKKPLVVTTTSIKKNGEVGTLEIHAFPIFDQEKSVVQVIEYMIDISERKKIEKQLLRSERLAGIGELAAGIAHEIKNPLGNISFAAQFCLEEFKLDNELKQYLEIIHRNAGNANSIIKELLDFANPREINYQLYDVRKIVENTLELIKARCEESNVQIIKDFAEDIPKIKLDEKWIEQAFLNICLNALDAIPDHGKIIISIKKINNRLVLLFEDNGKGINAENLAKIFDPFFTTKTDGVGLGLSLVHQIVREQNGDIQLSSKLNKGTQIKISFPAGS